LPALNFYAAIRRAKSRNTNARNFKKISEKPYFFRNQESLSAIFTDNNKVVLAE
jgi:hypothetical protein